MLLAGDPMPLTIHSDPNPFRLDDHGTIRIGKTRVTLDTLIAQFHNGDTPEQIVQNFPTLALADVYSAFGYYLRHQAEVDAYLAARDKEADDLAGTSPAFDGNIRQKIRERMAHQKQQPT